MADIEITVAELQAQIDAINSKNMADKISKCKELLPHIDRLTEGEEADLFRKYLRNHDIRFLHCKAFGWMHFKCIGEFGGVWEKGAEKILQTIFTDFLKEQIRAVSDLFSTATDDAERKRLEMILKFILRMDSRRSVENVLALLKGNTALDVEASVFDSNEYVLNTPSGLVELTTGFIRKSEPEDFCTQMTGGDLPPDFYKNGKTENNLDGTKSICKIIPQGADMWQDFLQKITQGNEELLSYLQLCAGMFLYGRADETLFMAYGNGGNGKSTFFNTLSAVMGDYATSGDANLLVLDSNAQHKNFELASLQGKRLLVLAELSEGKRLNESMLKRIASNDPVHAEVKYGDSFNYWPTHSPILYTNCLPSISSTDEGTWRRIALIPFNFSVKHDLPQDLVVLDYAKVLYSEAGSAVLVWMIEGATRLAKLDYKIPCPSIVRNMIDNYRTGSDSVLMFLGVCDYSNESYRIKRPELYCAYQSFCERSGVQNPVAKSRFFHRVEDSGYSCKMIGGYFWYYGICPPETDLDA